MHYCQCKPKYKEWGGPGNEAILFRNCNLILNCNSECNVCSTYPIGLELSQKSACSILTECGIQDPDWGKIGKCLGLDSHILSTSFFKKWHVHAHNCNPSWERLASALEATGIRQYKQAVPIVLGKKGLYHIVGRLYNYVGIARTPNI